VALTTAVVLPSTCLDLLRPWLEPGAVVDEEAGAAHLRHVLGRRLPVVRLHAGRHERDHLGAIAGYLPREFVDGKDADHDQRLAIGHG